MLSNSQNPTKTSIVQNGRRRITSSFPDRESIEEYLLKTDELISRKWRNKSELGVWSDWVVEVGEMQRSVVGSSGKLIVTLGVLK